MADNKRSSQSHGLKYSITENGSKITSVVVVVLALLFSFLLPPSADCKLGPPLWHTIPTSNNFTQTKWQESSSQFSLEIAKKNVPTVITDGPAANWREIANAWDIQQLISMSSTGGEGPDELKQCRRASRPLFLLERERDKGGMIGGEQSSPVVYKDTSLSHFWNTLLNKDEYLYWTGLLSSFPFLYNDGPASTDTAKHPISDDLLHKTLWKDFHVLDPELAEGLKDRGDDFWEPMLWLSHPGVVAQTHFDSQHNFFSVLFGTRRFTFFPPSMELNPFPSIHRSSRQSQLQLEKEADASVFEKNNGVLSDGEEQKGASILQIDLHPGDTLYIPPYWSHRVESLTLSLGVSVTSPSAVEVILQQAYWQAVPLGSFYTLSEKQTAVNAYLQLLVEKVMAMPLKKLAGQLYQSRYSLMFPSSTSAADFSCHTGGMISEDINNKFEFTAQTVADIVEFSGANADIKRLFLGDYVEQMSRWAVGPEDTVWFIHHCLTAT